ncbi:hypothetical protein [Micromonospora echinofusca]|uniref:Acetyltransferase (GNAT) family protein n=1 Tax=Micromonospora echinofusca TaxID=47858 RepID=A0ABS3VZT6_MICEH|nr:hypothetical protein [Micromonospora echinofusca]MBO4210051.1 hypothetical protein [Micromonospora echinofusca]
MSIDVVPFDVDNARAVEAAYRIGAAARRADLPDLPPICRQQFSGQIRHPWAGNTGHWALAHVDVARLATRIGSDVPHGDLEIEPQSVGETRLRHNEQVRVACGRRRYQCAAVHTGTGRLVAWTALELAATVPWHACQEITIVDPAHRGHRLGLLVKLDNLRQTRAAEPELRAVDTWNAAENTHMVAINEAIGFRPVDDWVYWQLTI